MIEILSCGDFLEEGDYSILCKFRDVINFVSGEKFAALVSENIGAAPLNIVAGSFNGEEINSLSVKKDSIVINNESYKICSISRYDSSLNKLDYSAQNVKNSIAMLENILINIANPKSLIFICDRKRSQNFLSGFEREFVRTFFDVVCKIDGSDDELLGAVLKIKGLGFGLTPSGDDFICGILYAMFITENDEGMNNLSVKIYENSKGKNPMTNAFLKCACEGRASEKLKDLLAEIGKNDVNTLYSKTRKYLQTGETSGADLLAGLLTGLRRQMK